MQSLEEPTVYHMIKQCTDSTHQLVISLKELVNHVKSKADSMILQNLSRVMISSDIRSTCLENATSFGMKCDGLTLHKSYCSTRSFVYTASTGPAPVDSSNGEIVHNTCAHNNDALVTTSCIVSSTTDHTNRVDSEEETDITKDHTSLLRATLHDADFIPNKEPPFMPFVSDDDGFTRNEPTFGVLPSDRRNVNHSSQSYKARIVSNPELTVVNCETDGALKPKSHHLALPHHITSGGPVKEPMIGNYLLKMFIIPLEVVNLY